MSIDFATTMETEFEGQTFKSIVQSKATIRGKTFTDCTFTRCSFVEAIFDGCKFRSCAFNDCDLSLVRVPDSVFAVTFTDSKVIGVNWTQAHWSKNGIQYIHFTKCAVNYSNFLGLSLKKMQLFHCIAHDVDFAEADLTKADCRHTDFAESRFFHTNLTEADMRGATNYTISPLMNTIKKAKFSLPEAIQLLKGLEIQLFDSSASE